MSNKVDDHLSRRSVLKAGATAGALALGGGAAAGISTAEQRSAVSTAVDSLPFFVVDTDGNSAPFDEPDTPLYDMRTFETRAVAGRDPIPVTAPNGNHVTWDEFSEVTGRAEVACVEKGTRSTLHLDGLIPNGLYTVWQLALAEPGFDGTLASLQANSQGAAPLGVSSGTQSEFRASTTGHGYVSAVTPPESTLRGPDATPTRPLEACALDEYDYHLVGAYHIDDRTHGVRPGDPGTVAEQFGFAFRDE